MIEVNLRTVKESVQAVIIVLILLAIFGPFFEAWQRRLEYDANAVQLAVEP